MGIMEGSLRPVAVPKRIEALAYILDRIQRTGTAPSYGEIGKALKPQVNTTRVVRLLDQLVALGLIERPPASHRGIRIRDIVRCRQAIEEALGQQGWWHAAPLGDLAAPPCTIEHLPLLPLILDSRGVD